MKTNRIQRVIYRSHPQKTMRIFFETIIDTQSPPIDARAAYTILYHASVSNGAYWTPIINDFVRDTGLSKKTVAEFLFQKSELPNFKR